MKRRSHLDRPQSPLVSTTMSLRRFKGDENQTKATWSLGRLIKVLLVS